jgi:isoleucyl-tRNA synthetase
MSETPTVDYKSTIQLPQTDFPMKANLPTREPEILKVWSEKNIYQKMIDKNQGKKSFVMPDGPPYANGAIHVGHALNKVLKDIIIKYKNMSGFKAPFIPGWDCHGLPIEHAVMKNLGAKAKEKSDIEIRDLCRAEAQKWVDAQRTQFRRLGVLADWDKPYITMDPGYEAEEIREFARAYEKGVVFLGVKPVYWNWTLQTALADAEVEYHMHKSPSIYVKFPVKDSATLEKLGVKNGRTTSFVIWTTTPWTLPANLGICLNENFEYGIFDTGSENLVFAKDLQSAVEKDTGLNLTLVGTVPGKSLEYGQAHHPFLDRSSLIVLGPHVTADAGTGCVHTAPGHGADDYKVGLKYGLAILSPVDAAGCYTDEFPEMKGTNIFKANPLIVEKLRGLNALLGFKEIEHSYPHCWRSKTPLIFRATPQWFIGMDLENSNIRQQALKSLQDIQFYPAWGEARLKAMMEGRPDWCLSRQRIWGVPIPIFYCKKTGKPLADVQIMMKVADVVEKNGGINAFYNANIEDMIGKIPAQGDFGSEGFVRGKDILDVWFDSGVCHAAVQRRREGLSVPADIYLEGSDQHRGWFNTSLLSSLATHGVAPFKALITHGFVFDSHGKKMSKSLGNVVDPMETANKLGIEILRLWCVYEDYGRDLSCGPTEFDRVTETYRRIRNTLRYLLGATSDFDPAVHSVDIAKMPAIDQWALHKLNELIQKVSEAYSEYSFYKVYHLLNTFFTVELSAIYLDILKDRLYTGKKDGIARRSSQTVLHLMIHNLLGLMAPILSFLAEETYAYVKGPKQESIFLTDFPIGRPEWKNDALATEWQKVFEVRTDVQKTLENLRAQKVIGSSLEAVVTVHAESDLFQLLSKIENLREIFIVSQVNLAEGKYTISAEKMGGEKCVRCWTYTHDLTKAGPTPGICPKCVEALS